MKKRDFYNLTGKVLIAAPFAMEGNIFHKSLIYIVKHTEEGSVGLIFNQAVHNAPTSNLFKKFDLNIQDLGLDIHIGGPVEIARGFFLHSAEYNENLLFNKESNNLAVSSNRKIMQDIASGSGPENSLFIIGYTGWSAGQLEFELEHNLWFVSDPDHELIFSNDSDVKWEKAINKLGISNKDLVVSSLAYC